MNHVAGSGFWDADGHLLGTILRWTLCDILGSKINLGDDIQSPLTKVGIEKRVPTGKASFTPHFP